MNVVYNVQQLMLYATMRGGGGGGAKEKRLPWHTCNILLPEVQGETHML